jgi:hypothetical protein
MDLSINIEMLNSIFLHLTFSWKFSKKKKKKAKANNPTRNNKTSTRE